MRINSIQLRLTYDNFISGANPIDSTLSIRMVCVSSSDVGMVWSDPDLEGKISFKLGFSANIRVNVSSIVRVRTAFQGLPFYRH